MYKKKNTMTPKTFLFMIYIYEKLFVFFASFYLRTIFFVEKCEQFLFAKNLQSVAVTGME